MTAPPTPRRWFQFGLLTMFVVVTAAAALLGWLGYRIRDMRARQAAYEHIMGNRGSFACWDKGSVWRLNDRHLCAFHLWTSRPAYPVTIFFPHDVLTPEERAWVSAFPEADVATPSNSGSRSGLVRFDEPGSD